MTGKTHKFLGIVAGAAISYFGTVTLKEPLYILALTSAPIGAMLPDIDHNRTKIGRSRKQIIEIISMTLSISISVAIIFFIALGYLRRTLIMSLLTIALIAFPFIALYLLSKTNFIKNNIKFMTKHRGLLHTLILPLLMCGGIYLIKEPVLSILLKGILAGYMTHLFADLLTIRGCPILYPFTKKNFRLSKIKTGSIWEYIGAIIISIGIISIVLVTT